MQVARDPDARVLEVDSLTVRVAAERPYEILSEVSLSLSAGDVLGLVGESGSGKTTLSLALLGYARPGTELSGSVRIDGTEVVAAGEAARRQARGHLVSYVPQDPLTAMNPALRIGVQLAEVMAPTRPRRADGARILEVLEKVHLPASDQFLKRYPHQLSGGQVQRVSIAMAMLNRPRLIVFDEPTTGLDVTTQSRVLATIQELIASENAAAVYVTHDLSVVGSIANRIAVMYAGTLVEEAAATTIFARPAHPYTRRLVLATPTAAHRRELAGIPGAPPNPRNRTDGCAFAPRCEFREAACMKQPPQLVPVEPHHRARCLRTELVRARVSDWSGHPTRPSIWQERIAVQPALLSLTGINAWYGPYQVVHDVNLSLRAGTCLALVGESGSGKTTIARCLSGLHPERVSGQMLFAGSNVPWQAGKRQSATMREVQYIFQNPLASLNPRHTIGRIIAAPLATFGLCGRGIQRRLRVRELLERVALPADYEHRYPTQLSGGERQRVAIARALAAEPRLLVCDEITSSLDVSIQASILQLLGQLRLDENLTLLFITHNIGLVRAIADDVVILNGGRIVEGGRAADILDRPADPYTRDLLSNTPSLDEVMALSA
jgi:oligopeptide/dipeptide ABC transporter ATP-binding protein